MKYPQKVKAYCAKCKKHTEHKAKLASKGRARTLAWGNRRHARRIKGYVGKVAGEKPVRKQGKRQKIVLTCSECKTKSERVIGSRTKKKLEIQK